MSNIRPLPIVQREPAAWSVPPEPDQAAAPSARYAALRAELLGDLNHDLRTPLNGIIGLALALQTSALTPGQREMVDLIRVSGETLERVLSEVLTKARERALIAPARPRVLVVDDQAINRAAVAMMLEDLSPDIVEAEDGEEAVSFYADGAFDLVIMDVEMPRMDGLAATRAIRYLEREEGRGRTPIFMLTARCGPENERAAMAAGADLHLAKPVTGPRLLAAATSVLPLRAVDAS